MLTHQNKTVKIVAIEEINPQEKRFQEQRMKDLLLLIENLALKEEATIKLIIECLYDVGMINLINKKIKHPSANKIVKRFISLPKPIAKVVAWRWLKKNLPIKLTNWLGRKVS
ncbi:hypothetical protein IQ215_10505 [Cyanobacterium stanieri LEGE 03274]|uniref:Uncharacterized protein n=1 Tax=Cyanobacterium stanieri LEGE 03274 TaxID=1828756 RepID=A0ABR9V5F3_9CHRO|nr:hypothetical protein [Cyanobacterium stanieri]MBE9223125.1 hypothetical protein [Cyanobacterium stanieri LEGE 03274]